MSRTLPWASMLISRMTVPSMPARKASRGYSGGLLALDDGSTLEPMLVTGAGGDGGRHPLFGEREVARHAGVQRGVPLDERHARLPDVLPLAQPLGELDEGGAHLVRIAALGRDTLVQRGRVYCPGADGVTADPLRHEVRGDRLGEANDGRLCRAIDEAVGHAAQARGDGGHVHDAAAARLQHGRQEGADHAVHGGDVEVAGEAPVRLLAVENGPVMDKAGAVHQDIERAQAELTDFNGLGMSVMEISRRSTGATRSGLIGKSSELIWSSNGGTLGTLGIPVPSGPGTAVVAAGGDGTVSEGINGLSEDFDRCRLAIVPLGTANDFATAAGVPEALDEALESVGRWVAAHLSGT